jgi:hypothetical protein
MEDRARVKARAQPARRRRRRIDVLVAGATDAGTCIYGLPTIPAGTCSAIYEPEPPRPPEPQEIKPRGWHVSVALRLGITAEQYLAHLAVGEKWCTDCKAWHLRKRFGPDRSRGDGLAKRCREAARARQRARDARLAAAASMARAQLRPEAPPSRATGAEHA